MMFLRFSHATQYQCFIRCLVLLGRAPLYRYTTLCLSPHQRWALGFFPLWGYQAEHSYQQSFHKSLCGQMFHFSWAIPRSGIAGPYSKFVFNFLSNYLTRIQRGCTILYPPLVMHEFPFRTSAPRLTLVIAKLLAVKWYLNVAGICISLMTKECPFPVYCTLDFTSLGSCI